MSTRQNPIREVEMIGEMTPRPTPAPREAPPREASPQEAPPRSDKRASLMDRVKDAWREYLDQFAPPGLSSSGVNDINDAYRHYMSAAELSRSPIGPDITFALGDLNEKINSAYSPESTKMDYSNNYAGMRAGRTSGSGVESSLAFMRDVAQGKIKVIDPSTGKIRETTFRDLPHYSSDAVEDRYRPDRGGDTDLLGGDDGGTMLA